MAYNKARAEKEWLAWKNAEEKQLREHGVDEDTIQRLYTYDWAQFNKERQYLQRWDEWSSHVERISAQELNLPVENVQSLLDSIENTNLLRILSTEDKITIEATFLRMQGYSWKEICQKLGITAFAYYNRIKRFKEKLKFIRATKKHFFLGYRVNGKPRLLNRAAQNTQGGHERRVAEIQTEVWARGSKNTCCRSAGE